MKSNKLFTMLFMILLGVFLTTEINAQGFEGYYRHPDVNGNTIVFNAEGDLWTVPLSGGLARRLTTHPEMENFPSFSPDGKTIAFSATYEGPREVYTIPTEGGLTTRWTYESSASLVETWTPDGRLVYTTGDYSKVPDDQLVMIDPSSKTKSVIPLSQASEASFSGDSKTVFFVRPAYHNNVTKRYQGGTARQIWKYTEGESEAIKLTKDHNGGSHHPMWFNSRVYFITDRDGTMNIWSIDENGSDLQQHTKHAEFDVRYANIHNGNIVYQFGADIRHLDVNTGADRKVDIRIVSDLDHLREKWDDNPSRYITSVHSDTEGSKIVITARGRVLVAPAQAGRFVSFTEKKNVCIKL